MKFLVLSLLLASASAVAVAADTPSLNGKWKIHSNIAGNENDAHCTFTLKDNDLSGPCKTESGDSPATGTIDGTKVRWSYNSEYNGTPLTVKYDGTLDATANTIAGTVTVPEFGVDGEFTAAPEK